MENNLESEVKVFETELLPGCTDYSLIRPLAHVNIWLAPSEMGNIIKWLESLPEGKRPIVLYEKVKQADELMLNHFREQQPVGTVQ